MFIEVFYADDRPHEIKREKCVTVYTSTKLLIIYITTVVIYKISHAQSKPQNLIFLLSSTRLATKS